MWNQFEFLNKSGKEEFRIKLKRLLIGWAVCSCMLFILFAAFWIWRGVPEGPEGIAGTWIMTGIISVLAPPIVWIIGKALIG